MKHIKLTCQIVDTKGFFGLKTPEAYKQAIQDLLKYCAEKRGGFVSFTLSAPRKPRTTGDKSQNHHLNGHIQQISLSTGQPFEDVKKYVKSRAIDMGYPMLYRDGVLVLDLWDNPIGISEADASTEECSLLIESAHMVAAELGVILEEE